MYSDNVINGSKDATKEQKHEKKPLKKFTNLGRNFRESKKSRNLGNKLSRMPLVEIFRENKLSRMARFKIFRGKKLSRLGSDVFLENKKGMIFVYYLVFSFRKIIKQTTKQLVKHEHNLQKKEYCLSKIKRVKNRFFARINFREWPDSRFFARINFREWPDSRFFAGVNFRDFDKNSRNRESFFL